MLTITRTYNLKSTTGKAHYDNFECSTLELPRGGNQPNISCIPSGIYDCKKIISPNLGECFKIMDVPNRSLIRGHSANFTRQLLGCVAFGELHEDIDGDGIMDVTSSKKTFKKLMDILPDEFKMEVV